MLVTALAPHIGYDRAAQIAKHAHRNGLSLREAALAVGGVSAEDFDAWVDPAQDAGPRPLSGRACRLAAERPVSQVGADRPGRSAFSYCLKAERPYLCWLV